MDIQAISKLSNKQIRALKQMQLVEAVKSTVVPVVTNPISQLLIASMAIEYLQRQNFTFSGKAPAKVQATYQDRYEYQAPLISEELGATIQKVMWTAAVIQGIGKSQIIEQLTAAGQQSVKTAGGMVKDVLPLLLTAGAVA